MSKRKVQFKDYPGEHPVKFVLNFKKIFPSVMELMLPVLPENENLEEMSGSRQLLTLKPLNYC